MNDDDKKIQSLVQIGNNQLVKTNNAIAISNKLIHNQIEKMFNEAFYLLNSRDINEELRIYYLTIDDKISEIEIDINYLSQLEKDDNYLDKMKFRFRSERYCRENIFFEYKEYTYSTDVAIWLFDKILKLQPNHKYSYLFRGIAQISEDNLNHKNAKGSAGFDFYKATEIDKNYSDAYYHSSFIWNNHLGDQISKLNKVIEINPNYSLAYYNRGKCYNFCKNYKKAKDDFKKALEIDPGYFSVFSEFTYYLSKVEKALNEISK